MITKHWKRRIDEAFKIVSSLQQIHDFPTSFWLITQDWMQIRRLILVKMTHTGQLVEIARLNEKDFKENTLTSLPPLLGAHCLEISRKWRIGEYDHAICFRGRDLGNIDGKKEFYWSILPCTTDTFFLVECEYIENLQNYFTILSQFLFIKFQRMHQSLKEDPLVRSIDFENTILPPLSQRQILVASLIAKGKKNREIATELKYSESLVRKETMKIFQHYGISKREQLVISKD